jgi:calmodulin
MPRKFKFSTIYANKFTREMISVFEETFDIVANEQDRMPVEMLPTVLSSLGLDVSTALYRDITDTKTIDFEVFLSIVSICIENTSWMMDELLETFNIFDKDGDGSLDKTELKRVFTKLGESLTDKELDEQIKEFDVDCDCEVGFSEWVMMFNNTRGVDFVFNN